MGKIVISITLTLVSIGILFTGCKTGTTSYSDPKDNLESVDTINTVENTDENKKENINVETKNNDKAYSIFSKSFFIMENLKKNMDQNTL